MANQQINSASAANRYGAAIFELANEGKALAQVEKQLKNLAKLVQNSAPLSQTLASPLVNAAEKNAVLQALAKKSKFSPLVANFIGIVCQNGRATELIEIVDAFLAKVAAAKGLVYANAKTAQALSTQQKTNLAAGLKKTLGRPVQLETEVDSRLLGGLIVQVGSRMFDSSLQTQLAGLKIAMKES
ncbi:ATP synthase delta chain [hydrothermal vent metagenome]|uniref:ATP synthase delta chain n=1 Tax=hydrothermal vent metagenome TaxID=652676 RepID=A0A3B0SEB0_9ZZZZ